MVFSRVILAATCALLSDGVSVIRKAPSQTVEVSPAGEVSNLLAIQEDERNEWGAVGEAVNYVVELGKDLNATVANITDAIVLLESNDTQTEGFIKIVQACEWFLVQYVDESEVQKVVDGSKETVDKITFVADVGEDMAIFQDTGDNLALARAIITMLEAHEANVCVEPTPEPTEGPSGEADDEGALAQRQPERIGMTVGTSAPPTPAPTVHPDIENCTRMMAGVKMIVVAAAEYGNAVHNNTEPVVAGEALYDDLVEAAVVMMGGEDQLTGEAKTIITILDATIGNMTAIVDAFTREKEEKELCKKEIDVNTSAGTEPTTCESGRQLKYNKCIKPGQRWFHSLFAPHPTCEEDQEKCHGKCVAACPAGSEFKQKLFKKCVCKLPDDNCPDSHPASTWFGKLCGKDSKSLSKYGKTLIASLEKAGDIGKPLFSAKPEPGSALENITKTIEAGIEVGLELHIPNCVDFE